MHCRDIDRQPLSYKAPGPYIGKALNRGITSVPSFRCRVLQEHKHLFMTIWDMGIHVGCGYPSRISIRVILRTSLIANGFVYEDEP